MKLNAVTLCALASICLAACGGSETSAISSPSVKPVVFAAAASDTAFSGNRANYTITKSASGYAVKDNVGSDGTRSVTGGQVLKFADVSVNLGIADKTQTIAADDLKSLIELYVAFFNRVPDADGLGYWIDQFKSGQSMDQIALSFYNAAVQYTSLTGYSASMSNADFVKVIYKNVLGRSGTTAPPDADVQYWAGELASGRASKGSLIRTMLASAHSFTNDATWGWVAQLLDNKVTVANTFAVQQGLSYTSSEDSITKGMAIAAAVTPTSTASATSMIPAASNPVSNPAAQYQMMSKTSYSACAASTWFPSSANASFDNVPDWGAKQASGKITLNYSNGQSDQFSFSGPSGTGSGLRGDLTYALSGDSDAPGRIVRLLITYAKADAQGCNKVSLFMRDNSKTNLPPVPNYTAEVAIGLKFGEPSTYYFQTQYGSYGFELINGSKDADGKVVSVKWTSSKNNKTGTGVAFSEIVYPNETVTFTLTATDDQGASTTITWKIGELDAVVKQLGLKIWKFVEPSGRYETYYQLSADYSQINEYNCDTQSKTCSTVAYSVHGAIIGVDLRNVVFNSETNFTYTDASGGQYSFNQAASLPYGIKGTVADTSSSTGSSNTGTTSTNIGRSGVNSCTADNYAGPDQDPQFDSFCRIAYVDACLDKATGTATYKKDAEANCTILTGLLQASPGNGYSCQYCPYH